MCDCQNQYKKIIEKFKNQCEGWRKDGIDAVFNKDLMDENISIGDVKYIVVADNPGENEKKNLDIYVKAMMVIVLAVLRIKYFQ